MFESEGRGIRVRPEVTPDQVAGAKMMGLKGVGSIEKGNWADLLVLNANPLTDIANARQMIRSTSPVARSTWRRPRRTDPV